MRSPSCRAILVAMVLMCAGMARSGDASINATTTNTTTISHSTTPIMITPKRNVSRTQTPTVPAIIFPPSNSSSSSAVVSSVDSSSTSSYVSTLSSSTNGSSMPSSMGASMMSAHASNGSSSSGMAMSSQPMMSSSSPSTTVNSSTPTGAASSAPPLTSATSSSTTTTTTTQNTTTTTSTTTTSPPPGTTSPTDYIVDVVVPQSATEGALYNTIANSVSFEASSLVSVECLPISSTGDGRNVTTKLCMVTVNSFAAGSLLVALINSRNLVGEVNVLVAVVSMCGVRNSSSVACVNQTHQGAAATDTSGGKTASVEFGGSKVAAVICIIAGVVAFSAGIAAVLIHKGNKERDEVSTAEAFHRIQQRLQSKRQSSVVTLNTSNATYDDL